MQGTIEDIRQDIASKRKLAALDGVRKARTMLSQQSSSSKKLLSACGEKEASCQTIIETMKNTLDPLEAALKQSVDAFNGSEQERAALDSAYKEQSTLSKQITALEENMVPKGYKASVPSAYKDLPQLEGRATVEFIIKKPDNAPFRVLGENYPQARLVMVIDGYTGTYPLFVIIHTNK